MENYLKRFKYLFFLVMTALLFSQSALAEAPPVNTDIGNQAVLTYTGENDEKKTILSNLVITKIQQLFSVSITPDRTATTSAGQTVLFTHTVTNNGNGDDEISITAPDFGAGYTTTIHLDKNNNGQIDFGELPVTTTLGKVEANTSVSLLVSVATPAGATATVGPFDVTVTSKGDPTQTSKATETISFTENAAVTVMKSLSASTGTPDRDLQLSVYFKIGNSTLDTDAVTLNLTETLDSNFKYIPGSAKWVKFGESGEMALPDNGTIPGGGVNFKSNATTGVISLEVATIPKNSQIDATGGYLKFNVKVPKGTPAMTIQNKGTYNYIDKVGGIKVPDADTNTVTYEVIGYLLGTFMGETIDHAEPGEVLKFKNIFTNEGNTPAEFWVDLTNKTFPDGTQFSMTTTAKDKPETIPTINGTHQIGIIGRGEEITVNLYAKLPEGISGSDYSADLDLGGKISPTGQPWDMGTATDLVKTVSPLVVDLTNNQSLAQNPNAPGVGKGPEKAPVTEILISPGETGTFDLFINNRSKYVSDDFELAYSSSPTFANSTLPEGVTVTFTDKDGKDITKTGLLKPGEDIKVIATVTTEKKVLAGTQPLYFRAKSTITGASDIKYDAYTITPLRNIEILPNDQKSVAPGGTVVYTHTVTNTGNSIEGDGIASDLTLNVKSATGDDWGVKLFLDSDGDGIFNPSIDKDVKDKNLSTMGGLKPGQSVKVFLELRAPLTVQPKEVFTHEIGGTLSQGIYPSKPTVTSATDTTTIEGSMTLTIEKYQSLDGTTYAKTMQSAKPGQKIYYKIVATNIGSVVCNDVVVSDEVPQYTSLNKKATYTITPKDGEEGTAKPAETSPDANGKGAIATKPVVLQADEVITLYFDVTIDMGPKGTI